MQVAVLGAGFVGSVTAVVHCEQGHDVVLVETDVRRLAALRSWRLPFHEPGLEEALRAARDAGRLRVLGDVREAHTDGPAGAGTAGAGGAGARAAGTAASPRFDAVLLCVGTPSAADGSADLRFIEAAARDAGLLLARQEGGVVAVKSTVPPGTARAVAPIVAAAAGRAVPVASLPEFLAEGSALRDARRPDRVVVGCDDPGAADVLARLHAGFDCPVLRMSPEAAESVKYAANAMLAVRIAFTNEVANLCEAVGVDVDEVMAAVGRDRRIGPAFLTAGPGFGGSCFPKDVAALASLARARGVPSRILDAALAGNDDQPLRPVQMVEEALGSLDGARVALLGLAFKPGTSDCRSSRSLVMHEALRRRGATVVCHDPVAGEAFQELAGEVLLAPDTESALRGADACILATAWPEYAALPPERFARLLRRPVVVDAWRLLDRDAAHRAGLHLRAVGVGSAPAPARGPAPAPPASARPARAAGSSTSTGSRASADARAPTRTTPRAPKRTARSPRRSPVGSPPRTAQRQSKPTTARRPRADAP